MHYSFLVFLHATIPGPLPYWMRSQGICQRLTMRKMAMSLDFAIREVTAKKKVKDERR